MYQEIKNLITTEIKNLIRNYTVQIYENKIENPDELDTFFEIHKNSNGNQCLKEQYPKKN